MQEGKFKKRYWWLSGILSLVVTGLGQVYNGELIKGIVFYLSDFIITPTLALILKLSLFNISFLFFLSFAISLFSSIEAMIISKKKQYIKLKPYNRWYVYVGIIIIIINFHYFITPLETKILKRILPWTTVKYIGDNMKPLIEPYDQLLVDTKEKDFKVNDIVYFNITTITNNKTYLFLGKILKIETNNSLLYQINHSQAEPEIWFCVTHSDTNHKYYFQRKNIIGKVKYIYWSKDIKRIGKKF